MTVMPARRELRSPSAGNGENEMGKTSGWNIWGKSGTRIRQFTVAIASEPKAIEILKAENPDLEVLSRHVVGGNVLTTLRMTEGDITEWVPLDCKDKLARTGGVPINVAMKR
jgi:hypothetical protein